MCWRKRSRACQSNLRCRAYQTHSGTVPSEWAQGTRRGERNQIPLSPASALLLVCWLNPNVKTSGGSSSPALPGAGVAREILGTLSPGGHGGGGGVPIRFPARSPALPPISTFLRRGFRLGGFPDRPEIYSSR